MKKTLLMTAAALLLVSCAGEKGADYTSFVDTSIGTGGHGHVFVGADVPFGAIQLGPTSIPQVWDWCSGYHESDNSVIGFSHTHLSGTGIGDLFDVTVLPVVKRECTYTREGIADRADKSTEVSMPGFYSISLESGIKAELTATARTGFHRYTFPEWAEARAILVDLENGGCWDKVTDEDLKTTGGTSFNGHRHSSGWADNQKLWFSGEFDKAFLSCTKVADHVYRFEFAPQTRSVMLKLAISPKSTDGAAANMTAELQGWDFETAAKAATAAWNAELSKVEVETADTDAKTIFYTALYHSMIAPSLFCDNGEPARYTTFSLWDTYRAQMPLFSILHSEKENDVIQTFLDIFRKQGKLPVWHLMGCETNCMVGNPGIPVVADAILKGFDGFDAELAFKAMVTSAMRPDRGQEHRIEYGYIPYDLFENESVAYDLEYALADWALAQAARKLGHEQEFEYFNNRSKSYIPHFDSVTGFMRGVDTKGRFREPFNPFYATHRANDYCEGNAWQYTWLVPHDFDGLCECFGGTENLLSKLDSLFIVDSRLDGEDASPDISGLIGQYAHGNEPSHHILYFYTMAGQPWKTADLVRRVLKEMYFVAPDGLSGNEDVGQMSAWYVLSSLGFYQVEPAGGRYFFGSPVFDKATINLEGGKKFTIVAENNSDENRYIQGVTLNGTPLKSAWIDYRDIMAGGELVFSMGSEQTLWY
ncbi:MAG: glycoside hydrolase family 92 protein [Bacteroidales bacterium]|nr:glycoside hydrolase family 92 protein [Bacteroidales bacterium]